MKLPPTLKVPNMPKEALELNGLQGSPKELTEIELGRLLEVKISQGTNWPAILRNAELGLWLRFIVTKNWDIYLDTGSNTHEGMMESNGLQHEDVVIDNGLVRENEAADRLVFSYQSSPMTSLHHAAEKKVLGFLRSRGIKLPEQYEHKSYQQ